MNSKTFAFYAEFINFNLYTVFARSFTDEEIKRFPKYRPCIQINESNVRCNHLRIVLIYITEYLRSFVVEFRTQCYICTSCHQFKEGTTCLEKVMN